MPVKPAWLPAAAYATAEGWVIDHPNGSKELLAAISELVPYVPPVVAPEPVPVTNLVAVRFGQIGAQKVVKVTFSAPVTVVDQATIELKTAKESFIVARDAGFSGGATLVFPYTFPANTDKVFLSEQEVTGTILDASLAAVGKRITKEMASSASASASVPETMVGASSSIDGVSGNVPTPVAGDNAKFLRGDGLWATPFGAGGASDHGDLTGLSADDHPQYLNAARGDARYSQSSHTHLASELTEDPTNRLVSDTEKASWNGKQEALGFVPESAANKGVVGGYAALNGAGKVPSDQLPSYIDDVLEFATFGTLPTIGISDTIYLTLSDNKTYRWAGSSYVQISTGAVESVSGKTGSVTLDKTDVGLNNVDNTSDLAKPISTATQAAINALSFQPLNPVLTATTASFTIADEAKLDALAPMVGATALLTGVTGTVPAPAAGDQNKFLKADGTWAITGSLTNLTYGRVNAFSTMASTLYSSSGIGTKIPFGNGVYSSGMAYGLSNAGLIPSVSGRFRASWLAMCGSEEFLADGYFHVVQNGVSLGQVKYNIMQAAGVNQCSGFIDVDLAAGQEVSLHYRSENSGGDSLQWNIGSYFDLYQLPVAVSTIGSGTPTNDQVGNRYFDVGSMRMQWGTHNDGNVDTTTVTLPAPFATAAYVVTCSNSSGGSLSSAIEAKTAGSFDIDRSSTATTTQSWDWIAIGAKP